MPWLEGDFQPKWEGDVTSHEDFKSSYKFQELAQSMACSSWMDSKMNVWCGMWQGKQGRYVALGEDRMNSLKARSRALYSR